MIPDIRITIYGMYENDNSIFDKLELPIELENDRETIINMVMLKAIPVECVYPEPTFFKNALGAYSTMMKQSWKRIYDLATMKYDPLHDRQGTIKENENIKAQGKGTNSNITTVNNTTENKTSTFESGNYNNRDLTTNNGSDTYNGNSTTDTNSDRGKVQEISLSSGFRSVSDTINKELNLIPKINYIDIISDDIVRHFCVMIY